MFKPKQYIRCVVNSMFKHYIDNSKTKKIMKKQILSFALVATMVGAMVSGCGSAEKAASTGSDSTKVDSATTTAPAATDTAKKDTTKTDTTKKP